MESEGPHTLEICHRHAKNLASTGYTLRFKQLLTPNTAFIRYSHDALSRLQEARYNPASNLNALDADLLRRYAYTYDLAGNRLSESVALNGGTPTVTSHTYNPANQISNQGFTYDNNGNLTSDGTNTYTWDRANRLQEMNIPATTKTYTYAYDGVGRRHFQQYLRTTPQIVKHYRYLLDVQPALAQVLALTFSTPPTPFTSTTRFVYGPRSIFAQENDGIGWTWPVQDGLRSVRGVITDAVGVDSFQSYAPYGTSIESDPLGIPFGFTGEMTDANGLVYLQARYYAPGLGVFPSLDSVEMINRYQYVGGNPISYADPSGLCPSIQQDNAQGRLDALQCRLNVDYLRARYNVQILWYEDNLSEMLQNMCVEAATAFGIQPQDELPWSTAETHTITNAFRIFDSAYMHIRGFRDTYPTWGQQGANVKIIKRASLGGNYDTAGKTEYPTRTIAVSQDVWSNPEKLFNNQQQSWIILHEYGHVLMQDLGYDEDQQLQLATEFAVIKGFGSLFVSKYSYQGGWSEHLIEAITGTLWNTGYPVITGYDSSAGGRTGFATWEEHRTHSVGTFKMTKKDDPEQRTQYIINVRLNAEGTLTDGSAPQETAEMWILNNILAPQ